MTDRRSTPANMRVAHVSLRGQVASASFVDGEMARVAAPVADLLVAPRGKRDRQLIYGERVLVLERRAHTAFVQAEKDGFCGYVGERHLGADGIATHWVAAPATHLYRAPAVKAPDVMGLCLGARLTITATHAKFCETDAGHFVPRQHLRAVGDWADDPAAIAESLLGTPYLWGGNSRAGIDCSGLVQTALTACGTACPGDSDQQMAALGHDLPPGAAYRRGDLLFWKGHVGIAVSADRLIHANGHAMAVTHEDTAACIARIDAQGEGPLLAVRRLS